MTFRSDPSAPKKGSVSKCREASLNVNQSIVGLLTSVGTRNTPGQQSALQSKVNQVRGSLDSLRGSINALPAIDSDLETQALRISALQEQLRLKNDFILKIREKRTGDFFSKSEKDQNEEKSDEEAKDVEMKEDGLAEKAKEPVKDKETVMGNGGIE